jgi:hypothetical protein
MAFVNGTYNLNADGAGIFGANLAVQYTLNGTTWQAATGWTISPSHSYTSTAGGVTYVATGTPIANVRGLRAVGQVRVAGNSSNRARIREIKIYQTQNANITGYRQGAGKVLAAPAKMNPAGSLCAKFGLTKANCQTRPYYMHGGTRVAMKVATD